MKKEEKVKARALRRQGESIRDIADKVGVSKSTASIWVRDIELSKEQLACLDAKQLNRLKGAETNKRRGEERRAASRKRGYEETGEGDELHLIGCMLYWAEGTKRNNRSVVDFANSDVAMMKIFVRFLEECFDIEKKDMTIAVNCYTDCRTVEEIEDYWLDSLSLPRSCLRKTIVDRRPECTKRKRNGLLEYGTCKLRVYRTDIIQRIYGAMDKYKEIWSK
jgi:transcriptional regulator with XRE-family HTH domain